MTRTSPGSRWRAACRTTTRTAIHAPSTLSFWRSTGRRRGATRGIESALQHVRAFASRRPAADRAPRSRLLYGVSGRGPTARRGRDRSSGAGRSLQLDVRCQSRAPGLRAGIAAARIPGRRHTSDTPPLAASQGTHVRYASASRATMAPRSSPSERQERADVEVRALVLRAVVRARLHFRELR